MVYSGFSRYIKKKTKKTLNYLKGIQIYSDTNGPRVRLQESICYNLVSYKLRQFCEIWYTGCLRSGNPAPPIYVYRLLEGVRLIKYFGKSLFSLSHIALIRNIIYLKLLSMRIEKYCENNVRSYWCEKAIYFLPPDVREIFVCLRRIPQSTEWLKPHKKSIYAHLFSNFFKPNL